VAIATIQKITDDVSSENVQLQIIDVLKGPVPTPSLMVTVSSKLHSVKGMLPQSTIGVTGVWFLKNNSGAFEVLPLFQGPFSGRDLFMPVRAVQPLTVPTGTLGQQLLTYLLQWYEALSEPSRPQDEFLITALMYNKGKDSGAAISSLRTSAYAGQHVMGLIAAIRLGSPDALSQVADELETLRSKTRFNLVLLAIREYPPEQPFASIKALEKLIGLHSDVEGLDDAASTALARIGSLGTIAGAKVKMKAALPGMLLLLDSNDHAAQLRAVRFFSYFAMFTDANGDVPGTGVAGPFATAERSQFDPTETAASPSQYVQFWKDWCAKNRKQLGF
jgi:hypothetical protein